MISLADFEVDLFNFFQHIIVKMCLFKMNENNVKMLIKSKIVLTFNFLQNFNLWNE